MAQVLVNFENGRDAAKKLLGGQATNLRDDMDKAKDAENFDSALDETEEKDEKAWNRHRKMRRTYMKNEEHEESDDGATEDEESDDVSSAIEESSRQGPETEKPVRQKHKSHKHKKGGFHVYVEATLM